jgi:hypothetical protein
VNILTLPNIRGETYVTGRWVCVDLETTNRDHGDARTPENFVVCVGWQTGTGDVEDGPAKSYYGDLLECRELWDAIERTDFVVAQHCKFESHWCLRVGFDATSKLWADPMLFEWVLLGNNPKKLSLSLGAIAPRYGEKGKEQLVAALINGGVCPSEIPRQWLLQRVRDDVESTARVARKQIALLREREQLHLAALRCLMAPVLADIERNGIGLDRERVLAAHAEYTAKYLQLKEDLDKLTGGINERSPNEMIPFVYGVWPANATEETKAAIKPLHFREETDRRGKPKRGKPSKSWPDGRPKLNKYTLQALHKQAKTERQKQWLSLRESIGQAYAAISKNLDFFKGVVEESECWFYADLMQGVTATHRLSGRGKPVAFKQFRKKDRDVYKSVQGQNMPREFKSLQCSRRPGYKASDADAKQLEFRGAAFLGQDPIAIANIKDQNFDAHIQTLTVMLNGTYDDDAYRDLFTRYKAGDKEVKWQRNDNALCKSHTYKPLFGGESGTPVQEAYYSWFREHYRGITEECTRWLREVETTGEHRSASGLIFRFTVTFKQYGDEVRSFDVDRKKPLKPAVFNYPVQQLSTGEIVPMVVVCLHHRIKHGHSLPKPKTKPQIVDAYLTNTVHDSIAADVREGSDNEAAWVQQVRASFTEDALVWLHEAYGIDFNVPLGCEISIGSHIGEGQQFSFESQ